MQIAAMRMMNICTIHRILAKWDIPKLLWGLQKETMIMINLDWEEIFILMTNVNGYADIDNGVIQRDLIKFVVNTGGPRIVQILGHQGIVLLQKSNWFSTKIGIWDF